MNKPNTSLTSNALLPLMIKSLRSSLHLIGIGLFFISMTLLVGLSYGNNLATEVLIYGFGNGMFVGTIAAALFILLADVLGVLVRVLYLSLFEKLKTFSLKPYSVAQLHKNI